VHATSQVSTAEDLLKHRIANYSVLDVQLDQQNQHEPPVMVYSAEDVELVVGAFGIVVGGADDATVEHIEELHEDEGVEEEGVVLHAVGGGHALVIQRLPHHIVLDVE